MARYPKTRYSKKTDTELHYIIKDAAEAAQAMRGWNQEAELKYLDQMNDASTELYRRRSKEFRTSPELVSVPNK